MTDFATFEEFWPHYVREHAKPMNRLLHVVGTSTALGMAAFGLVTGAFPLVLAAPFVGYGASWIGHRFFQTWPPAAFQHPWWSFLADLRMLGLTLTGRMGAHVARATAAA